MEDRKVYILTRLASWYPRFRVALRFDDVGHEMQESPRSNLENSCIHELQPESEARPLMSVWRRGTVS